uniref:Uncharacterized protein n=1 Tax=viral metagenome TaxID=1070528 RepID=A0A6C0BLD2_9ZZZZ
MLLILSLIQDTLNLTYSIIQYILQSTDILVHSEIIEDLGRGKEEVI